VEPKFFLLEEWLKKGFPPKISLWKMGQNWGSPKKFHPGIEPKFPVMTDFKNR